MFSLELVGFAKEQMSRTFSSSDYAEESPVEIREAVLTSFIILGAPWWNRSREALVRLSGTSTWCDIAQAVLKGVVLRIKDFEFMNKALLTSITRLSVDGGMSPSRAFIQFQSDTFQISVKVETFSCLTSLGTAHFTADGPGISIDSGRFKIPTVHFVPRTNTEAARTLYRNWYYWFVHLLEKKEVA